MQNALGRNLPLILLLAATPLMCAGWSMQGKSVEELAEVFTRSPQGTGFDLSPQGDKFMAYMPQGGDRGLVVFDISDPELGLSKGTFISPTSKYEIGTSYWIDNDYIGYDLIRFDDQSIGFQIAKVEPGKKNSSRYAYVNSGYIDRDHHYALAGGLPLQKQQYLTRVLEIRHREVEFRFSSYILNEISDRLTAREIKKWRNPDLFDGWIFRDGEPYAVTLWKDQSLEGKDYKPVYTMDFEILTSPEERSPESILELLQPLELPGELEYCYPNIAVLSVLDTAGDKHGIQFYDLDNQKKMGKPIFAEGYSLVFGETAWGIRLSEGGDLIGIHYLTDRDQTLYFDPGIQSIMQQLEEFNPQAEVGYLGLSSDNKYLYYSLYSDTLSASYFRLHLADGKRDLLYTARPWLAELELPRMRPIQFENRNGQEIHGYLILPKNYEAGKPVPLVALSHGGPWVRDSWGFDAEAQFYASLGYAVLQVNYRGSKGYGIAFEFDEDMLEICEASPWDVIDGVRWAIDEGYANQERIAFVGASYGAYLSLFCSALDPDLPACAIGFAGVYDLEILQEKDEENNMPWVDHLYGEFDKQKDRVLALSPSNHAEKIKAPILLVHGGKDSRVGYSQANAMLKALRKHDKEVEIVKRRFLLHGFANEEYAREHYTLVGEFLRKHLGD